MPVTTYRTRNPIAPWDYDPFHPDGTWAAEWPPEVWLVTWRLKVLGYKPQRVATIAAITEAARSLYIERYRHEPPRRGKRRSQYTIVFEHDRVEVVDEAAKTLLIQPFTRKGTKMTSLTPTLPHPRDDTPAVYALTPGLHVFASDIGAHEADEVAELLEDAVWRKQREQRLAGGESHD